MSNFNNNYELENQLLALVAKLGSEREAEGRGESSSVHNYKHNCTRWGLSAMLAEVRTLDLWRAVIGECLAAVFYVLLVCGAYSPWAGQPTLPERHIVISMVAGFAMTVLVHCFHQVSGGHVNPAVTLALVAMRRVSPLRAVMYVLAQLGGGIAGAALLFGCTSSGYSGDLGATEVSRVISHTQGFGVEFLLSFVVVLAYFSAQCPHKGLSGDQPSLIVGLAYLATTLVGLPLTGASMNPARSLGPAFVMNKWTAHWVYWAGPILGGLTAGFIHEFIFNPRRSPLSRQNSQDRGGAEEEATLRQQASSPVPATSAATQHYNPLRRNVPQDALRQQHNAQPGDTYTPENIYSYDDYIYSGSKSLYTPSARASNLHRSQSVYNGRPLPVPGDVAEKPAAGELLHNNIALYNSQQQAQNKQQYQQQLLQQQQQHQQQQQVPNNINKPSSISGSVSQYSKNIVNLPQSESEYSTSTTRRTLKSNLIKPEPIYKTSPINHNNQNHLNQQQQLQHQLHHQQQQQSYHHHQKQPQQGYQQSERSVSVLSAATSSGIPNGGEAPSASISSRPPSNILKCTPAQTAEDDDASQYGGNYATRSYGTNRPELHTPGSVHSDMPALPNSMVPYSHYSSHINKMY